MGFFRRADYFLGKLYSRGCALVLMLLGLFGLALGFNIIFEASEAGGAVPFTFGLIFFGAGVYLWRRDTRLSDMI